MLLNKNQVKFGIYKFIGEELDVRNTPRKI
jgi:hypothetical protein